MESKKAVLILTFNRPNSFKTLLNRIVELGVESIYISIDGPREGNSLDKKKIEEISTIIATLSTKSTIKVNKFERNLGCAKGVTEGISWFFRNVEEGIILEDDCFPHEDFFSFCWELLDKYRNVDKIRHICGSSFIFNSSLESSHSFYFSRYANIWGWATWRKDWELFDLRLSNFSIRQIFNSSVNYYVKFFLLKNLILNNSKAWSFQWVFTIYESKSLAVTPFKNLVRNIGYDSDSTNTIEVPSWFGLMRYGGVSFPLAFPSTMVASEHLDFELTKSVHKFSFFKFLISFLPNSLKKGVKKILR